MFVAVTTSHPSLATGVLGWLIGWEASNVIPTIHGIFSRGVSVVAECYSYFWVSFIFFCLFLVCPILLCILFC